VDPASPVTAMPYPMPVILPAFPPTPYYRKSCHNAPSTAGNAEESHVGSRCFLPACVRDCGDATRDGTSLLLWQMHSFLPLSVQLLNGSKFLYPNMGVKTSRQVSPAAYPHAILMPIKNNRKIVRPAETRPRYERASASGFHWKYRSNTNRPGCFSQP